MKKTIDKKKKILIGVILSILVIGCGVFTAYFKEIEKDQRNMYMALQYLEMNDCEIASEYLENIDDKTSKKIKFARNAAEIIVQKIMGNENLSTIKMDIIYEDFGNDEVRKGIIEKLDTADAEYGEVLGEINMYLSISQKKQDCYQRIFDIEYLASCGSNMDEIQLQEYADLSGKNPEDLKLMSALNRGDYYSAITSAAERVKENSSADNRLLLADILATAVFSGNLIDETFFYQVLEKEYDAEKIATKNLKIEEESKMLQEKINVLQQQISEETDGVRTTELHNKIIELNKQQEDLTRQSTHATVYKAINSISNIFSVEAEVVKAKLYYALEQEELAVSTLVNASDSVGAKLSNNEDIRQGLNFINRLNKGEIHNDLTKTEEASRVLEEMLTSVSDIPVRGEDYYYSSETLVEALSGSVLSEYKYQNNNIYISAIDDSQYPQVSFSITAREEILKDILEKNDCIIKDTHHEVDYIAETETDSKASICFVVDISGSMGGEPLTNAKEALISYADTISEGTEIALVVFDDTGEIRTPITEDINQFIVASNMLVERGGTDIAAGLYSGIEALQEASGTKNIILMTDGQSNMDSNVIAEAVNNGVKVYTVGFGSVNQELLQQIADETGGTFTLADSSNDLSNVYESIGALIGSSIKIKYSVSENIEETPRYAYVSCKNFDVSQRKEYKVVDQKVFAEDFYVYNSITYVLGQDDELWNGVFYTTPNSQISNIEIDGNVIQPVISAYGNDRMYVEYQVKPLSQTGCYDVTFHFNDGSEYVAENAILVYKNEDVKYFGMIKIGDIYLYARSAIEMPNGRMALFGGVSISDAPGYQDERTLSAYTDNIMILEEFHYNEEQVQTDGANYLDWGDRAVFSLDGVITLQDNDAQRVDWTGGSNISTVGKIKGTIDKEQCVITKIGANE